MQLKYWTVNLFPVLWQPAVSGLISVAVILGVFATPWYNLAALAAGF